MYKISQLYPPRNVISGRLVNFTCLLNPFAPFLQTFRQTLNAHHSRSILSTGSGASDLIWFLFTVALALENHQADGPKHEGQRSGSRDAPLSAAFWVYHTLCNCDKGRAALFAVQTFCSGEICRKYTTAEQVSSQSKEECTKFTASLVECEAMFCASCAASLMAVITLLTLGSAYRMSSID